LPSARRILHKTISSSHANRFGVSDIPRRRQGWYHPRGAFSRWRRVLRSPRRSHAGRQRWSVRC